LQESDDRAWKQTLLLLMVHTYCPISGCSTAATPIASLSTGTQIAQYLDGEK
jgi:hypothetical protein